MHTILQQLRPKDNKANGIVEFELTFKTEEIICKYALAIADYGRVQLGLSDVDCVRLIQFLVSNPDQLHPSLCQAAMECSLTPDNLLSDINREAKLTGYTLTQYLPILLESATESNIVDLGTKIAIHYYTWVYFNHTLVSTKPVIRNLIIKDMLRLLK